MILRKRANVICCYRRLLRTFPCCLTPEAPGGAIEAGPRSNGHLQLFSVAPLSALPREARLPDAAIIRFASAALSDPVCRPAPLAFSCRHEGGHGRGRS